MNPKSKQFACQVQKIREHIDADQLAFKSCLSDAIVKKAIERLGIKFRDRIYTPWVTLWLFLNQVMSRSACQDVVTLNIANRVANGKSPCSAKTTSYCDARSDLPQEFYSVLLKETGRQSAECAPAAWKLRGREVKPIDGTTVSMPETEENCEEFPLQDPERSGLSFPLARLLVVFSLSVGTVLEVAIAPYRGKGTGEHSLLREVRHSLESGDIILGDCGFCSFGHLAELHQQGIDSIVKLDGTRWSNLRLVKQFNKNDKLYRWTKPKRNPATFTREEFKALPNEILVRVITVQVQQVGFRVKKFDVVTTLIDHNEYPAEEIAELYRRRWRAELNLRDIKSTLQMNHLSCKTPEMVRKEIKTHLIAYNLVRIQMAEAAQLSGLFPHQISFKSTLNTLQRFQNEFTSMTDLTLATMYATIAYHQVGKQPDRVHPRAIKRRSSFSYLTTPRQEFQALMT